MNGSGNGNGRRSGFTLVEMLVVMAIILMLAALTAYLRPGFTQDVRLSRGADRLTGWLLQARERARLDGRPTGLRLLPPEDTTVFAARFQFVQQPDDTAWGRWVTNTPRSLTADDAAACVPVPGAPANVYLVGGCLLPGAPAAAVPPGVVLWDVTLYNFDASQVAGGDYLLIRGGRPCHVTSVTAGTATTGWDGPRARVPTATLRVVNPPLDPANLGGPTTEFRLVRAPRPLLGEDLLTLPEGVALNTTRGRNVPTPNLPSLIPGDIAGPGPAIVFLPDGTVQGAQAGNGGTAVLWVANRDGNPDDPTNAVLIVVGPTGRVSQQPAGPPEDPYRFAGNTQGGGM